MDWIEPFQAGICVGLQPYPWPIVISLVGSLMILSATIGNALVILSYKRDRLLRDVHNLYVLHLAISDFILGSFSMPLYLVYTVMKWTWPFGRLMCKIYLAEDFTMLCMSSLCVILIGWDRLAIVTLGVRYKNVETSHRAYIKLIICWTISILLYTPLVFFWEVFIELPLMPKCDCHPDFYFSPGFIFFSSAACAGVSLLSLSIVNWMLYVTLKKRNTALIGFQSPQEKPKKSTSSTESQFSSVPSSLQPSISTTFSEEVLMYEDHINDPKPSSVVPQDHNTEEIPTNRNRNKDPEPSLVIGLPRKKRNTATIGFQGPQEEYRKSTSSIESQFSSLPTGLQPSKFTTFSEKMPTYGDRNNDPKPSSVLSRNPSQEEIPTNGDRNKDPKPSSVTSQGPNRKRTDSNILKYARTVTLIIRKKKIYIRKTRDSINDDSFDTRVSVSVDRPEHIRKRNRRYTLILIGLVLAMCVSMIPFSVITAIYTICDNCQNRTLYEICTWMFWLKSCMNPFLYAFNSPRFRKNMIDLLPCIRIKRK